MKKLFLASSLCLLTNVFFGQTSDSTKNVDIDEVTVEASRSDAGMKNIPQKVEIIDSKQLTTLPNENAAELLKRTTNIDIIEYPGMSAIVGMRGFSPSAHARSYTLILINGNPSGTDNLASINPDIIERIEIVKGPYSMLYGSDAMGGVINIITKSGKDYKGGSVTLSAGSFGSSKISGRISGSVCSKTQFSMGFSRQEQTKNYRIGNESMLTHTNVESLMLDKASFGDVMLNSKYQSNQINGQISHRINEKWTSLTEGLYSFAYDVETPGNYWGSYGQSKKDIDRINVYETVKRSVKNNTLTISPYFTNEKNPNYTDNTDTAYVSFKSTVKEYGFKISDIHRFGKIKMLFGADYDVYDYLSIRFSDKAITTVSYNPNNKNAKAAVLAQLQYAADRFDVNAGARFNYIVYKTEADSLLNESGGNDNYQVLTPSVGAQYRITQNLKAHSSFGTAFSVPDAFKMAGCYSISQYFPKWNYWYVKNYVGNPDLKPERSATVDAGLNFSLPHRLLLVDLTYFQTNHKDKIIEYTKAKDTTSFKNANNSHMKGLELMLSSNLGALFNNTFTLELYVNYTQMLENSVDVTLKTKSGTDSSVVQDLLYTRSSNGNFGVYFENNEQFGFRFQGRYIGSRLEKDNFATLRPEIKATDYYTQGGYTAKDKILKNADFLVFDASVFYTIGKNRLGVTISNLFDENYTEKDGYNMPGRMVSGSFTYSF